MKKILLAAMFSIMASIAASAQASPTWSTDVACIVYSHCSSCHNPTSIAPFNLLTYQDAYQNMYTMSADVNSRKMPPYLPNTNYQHYSDMRTLTAQEIRTITDWVAAGGPIGDTTRAPQQPVFTSSVAISNPDLTARIPNYVIPNTGGDLYRCFVITAPATSTKFIQEIEVIPGDRSAVHHVLVFEDTSSSVLALDNADTMPGYANFGGIGSNSAKLINGWVPGSSSYTLPAGMGIKLTQGSRIIVQIHYPTGSEGKLDSTRLNLKFYPTSTGLRTVSLAPILNHAISMQDGPLSIPADSVRTFHEQFTMPVDATVLTIAPHAHLVCTAMKAFFVNLANDTVPLIDIPKWDFHWQGGHSFQRPIKVPAGSVLHGIATYDNSDNNPEAPVPHRTVTVGEATTNEMMLFYFSYLVPYVSGDENIIIDTTSHDAHYLGCVSTYTSSPSAIATLDVDADVTIYPNPTQALLNYHSNEEVQEISITDITGKNMMLMSNPEKAGQLDTRGMSAGLYFIRIRNANGNVLTQRFVKE